MQILQREVLKTAMEQNEKFKLIEVLPTEQFREFHLPGAMNVPLSDKDFDSHIQKAADKLETVVLYCKDAACDAAAKAGQRMEQLGFRYVFDYQAGKDDWRGAGLHTEL